MEHRDDGHVIPGNNRRLAHHKSFAVQPISGDIVRCARPLYAVNHPKNSNHVLAVDERRDYAFAHLQTTICTRRSTNTYIITVLCGTMIAVILDNTDAI